jgi:hypothetical protein
MLDMIKASALPANLMHAAASGSLSMPPVETLEVLVYLTHNKIFGQKAKLTLAGWDLEATQAAVRDPNTPHEILDYFISPKNIRPKLLPGLLENPAVHEDALVALAEEGSRDVVRAMLASDRARRAHKILHPLSMNVNLTTEEAERVRTWLSGTELRVVGGTESGISSSPADAVTKPVLTEPVVTEPSELAEGALVATLSAEELAVEFEDESEEAIEALKAFERQHAAELAAEANTPFRPLGGTYGLETGEPENTKVTEATEAAPLPETETAQPAAIAVAASAAGGTSASAAAPAKIKHKATPKLAEIVRESVLQKIAKLDVKGRVQLAVRGSKEERSILIRDGTKLVALAVLQSPKISDGEVEKFAAQKNVLEATLRGITMHRRFMKNYVIIRNLTCNPRTPIDLSLGLVKNLMLQDLKNLSGNKEVSDTVRKSALRAYKQKLSTTSKD